MAQRHIVKLPTWLKIALKRILDDREKEEGADVLSRSGARGFHEIKDKDRSYFCGLSDRVGVDLKSPGRKPVNESPA